MAHALVGAKTDEWRLAQIPVTFSASSTTESKTLFTITGVVTAKIFGIVTTTFGSNHTAAHFRLNDGTTTPAITEAATGLTASSAAAGSLIYANADPTSAAVLVNATAAGVGSFPASNDTGDLLYQFILVKKGGAVTTLEYRYSTTNAPTSGAATFYCLWKPLSADGNVV